MLIRFIVVIVLLINVLGCEAFVRKFTRKSKKDQGEVRMVVTPEEYPAPVVTKEEAYRQNFLYWQSWHDELIVALSAGNHKKQVACADEAIKNLVELKKVLKSEQQAALDRYIVRLQQLRGAIALDYAFTNINRSRQDAERIKRDILQHFSIKHVKDFLS